ncbi:trehalose-phosphatase [Natronorubrum halophilum]|uniref:trehalose-phosphatase n=1 Tax=Natronorubrum halophilum TaxID=1702106 RepID=UPI0010C1BE71|nr:trehalose-phosphatase [Natronorubrum halophilum]
MSTLTPPSPIDEQRARIRSTLADASRLLLCLDFDGTLAPIVEEPDEATPTTANENALATLTSDPAVSTAIISGRALTDVRGRVDGPKMYAGNHGLELARRGSVAVHPVANKRASQVERVCETLETALESVPNYRIENKRLTGTVHVRSVPDDARPFVRRQTHAVVDQVGGDALEVSTGKRIYEIGPSIPWGKGNAVALIAADMPPDTVPIYIGDDVTDESAFRTVESDGIGVRVGGDEPSAASCRIDSPEAVARLLEWLGSVGIDALERGEPELRSISTRSVTDGSLSTATRSS